MGENFTDGERLAKLETEVKFIRETVLDLKNMLMFREESYITQQIHEEKMKNVYTEIQINKGAINDVKRDFENYKTEQSNNNNIKRQVTPNWWQVMIALCSLASTIGLGIVALYK